VGGCGDPMEEVKKVPEQDWMEIWTRRIYQGNITLLTI